jgi:RHS repeat-associated protein
VFHFHLDHLGSTQLITNSSGGVVEYVRYRPYGEIRGRFDGSGTSLAPNEIHRHEFTGYETEFTSGLQYAGARFYDPALGLFLTHDPARQFASPYSYGPWSPFNGVDPSGGFWLELFVAAIIGAFLSAAINVVIAAAQGASLSQIGKAALRGAITGAVGVGLGVVVSGLSTGFAALSQTLPANVTVQAAKDALVTVAYRSAFSTTLANAAGQSAGALGAPDALTTAITVVGGYLASAAFDQFLLPSKGSLALIEGKGAFQTVSSKATHSSITLNAARDAGFDELSSEAILASNLAQDGPADVGFFEGLFSEEVLGNQTHFGVGAQNAFDKAHQQLQSALSFGDRLDALGAASHYLQDQYALGHIFPGTHLLAGRAGWLFRGIIHQTVGGEVTFSEASYEATLRLFRTGKAI